MSNEKEIEFSSPNA